MFLKRKIQLFDFITMLFLLLVLSGSFTVNETDQYVYVLCVGYMLFSFFLFIVYRSGSIPLSAYPIKIALLMLSVWIYGFILAIINHNAMHMVIRNFAGMTMYLLTFFLWNIKDKQYRFSRLAIFMGDYIQVISVISYVLLTYFHFSYIKQIPILNAFVGGGGSAGFVQYYARELAHISFLFYFYKVICCKFDYKPFFMIFVAIYRLVVINDSGGDLLATAVLAVILLLCQFKYIKREIFALGIIFVCMLLLYIIYKENSFIFSLFSPADEGNARRYTEIHWLLQHISFWGYGLGKELGYAGAKQYNYGTEMVYLNIFHKFGVFAFAILFCFASSFWKAIKYLGKEDKRNPYAVVPLGLMAYLIPSLANPMLFSVVSVVSHILSMLIVYDADRQAQSKKNFG